VRILRYSALTATPWKNGGGITREVIRVPATGEPFRWRVSVAEIDSPGPFSDFAGYTRTLVLLRGNGVSLRLANGEERVLSEVGDLAQFDGACSAYCELKNGPCVDLNLIAAQALQGVNARVERLDQPLTRRAERGQSLLILPIDGAVTVTVPAGHGDDHGDEEGDGAGGGQGETHGDDWGDRAGVGDVLERWDLALLAHSSGAYTVSPHAQAAGAAAHGGSPAVLIFVATVPRVA
jgi:environmental stress-induced protein Ves